MERMPLMQKDLYDFITRLNNGEIECPVFIRILETGEEYNIYKITYTGESGQEHTHYAWERQ